jgi:hypothetical protein
LSCIQQRRGAPAEEYAVKRRWSDDQIGLPRYLCMQLRKKAFMLPVAFDGVKIAVNTLRVAEGNVQIEAGHGQRTMLNTRSQRTEPNSSKGLLNGMYASQDQYISIAFPMMFCSGTNPQYRLS